NLIPETGGMLFTMNEFMLSAFSVSSISFGFSSLSRSLCIMYTHPRFSFYVVKYLQFSVCCCRLPVPNLQSLRSWASSMLSPLACITVFMFSFRDVWIKIYAKLYYTDLSFNS
ncbi:hypothetical protein L9F63_003715, partial [Diploptera punctata]